MAISFFETWFLLVSYLVVSGKRLNIYQLATENIFTDDTQCDASRSKAITQLMCHMIEIHMMPIGVVEGEAFKELVLYLEPEYIIQLRATVTKQAESAALACQWQKQTLSVGAHWRANATRDSCSLFCGLLNTLPISKIALPRWMNFPHLSRALESFRLTEEIAPSSEN